jgi:hypothetical protein
MMFLLFVLVDWTGYRRGYPAETGPEQTSRVTAEYLKLTPKAENLFVRLLTAAADWLRKTSDLGRGGFLGLRMTRVSSQMSSSRSLESLETESCRFTASC